MLQQVERLATEVALLTGQGPPPGLPLLCIGSDFAQLLFTTEPSAARNLAREGSAASPSARGRASP